jgi:hypothetical protein
MGLQSINRAPSGGLYGCDDGVLLDHNAALAPARGAKSAIQGHRHHTANTAQRRRDECARARIRARWHRNGIAWERRTASGAPALFSCRHPSVIHVASFASRQHSAQGHFSPPRETSAATHLAANAVERLFDIGRRHTTGLQTTGFRLYSQYLRQTVARHHPDKRGGKL